MVSVATERM
uniref:Uncharacterized protein n=1 Tax=Anguilla anguilla TaxID=7936 RepID=A0A0E9UYA8_ANGAN